MPIPLHWHTEPLLLLLLIGAGWLYSLGVGPFRSRIAPEEPWPVGKILVFFSGLLMAYLTVGSPLDQIGETFLFSVHMVQHMLLIYVCPTLLLMGMPHWLVDAVLQNPAVRRVWRLLTHPVFAGLLFTFLYTLWHIPVLYELALRIKWVHTFEHWCLFLPALWMWWSILGPSRRLPPSPSGIQLIYIFALMVGQLPVFAFLTLSDVVLYPTYLFAARIVDLTPLQDQILGGIIMKVTNMVVSLTVLIMSFYSWYLKDSKDEVVA